MTLWDVDTKLNWNGLRVFDFGTEKRPDGWVVDYRLYRKRTPLGAIECKIWMPHSSYPCQQELLQANAEAVGRALDELSISRVLEHCP
jgi:hypothetical protein